MKPLTERQKKTIKIGGPVIMLLLGVVVASILLDKPVRAGHREAPPEVAKWVEVMTIHRGQVEPSITARGMVTPAHKVDIQARVEGEVISVSPKLIPGAQVKKGDVLLRIEAADYQSALAQAKAELAQTQADLHIEQGQQSVAYQEYQLLGEKLPAEQSSLILRQPQLKSAQAKVASAQASVNRAALNLTRTQVRAPFDGIVVSKLVDLGSSVGINSPLLSVLASDEFWITVTLAPKQLRWIDVPSASSSLASAVTVITATGKERQAKVLRLIPELTMTRQAQVLIGLQDPLVLRSGADKKLAVVMANEYVKVNIAGHPVDGLIELPRRAVRDGNQVWLMSSENRLAVREVEIVYRGTEKVYINKGISDGDRIITSLLKTPVIGTLLKAVTAKRSADEGVEVNDAAKEADTVSDSAEAINGAAKL